MPTPFRTVFTHDGQKILDSAGHFTPVAPSGTPNPGTPTTSTPIPHNNATTIMVGGVPCTFRNYGGA